MKGASGTSNLLELIGDPNGDKHGRQSRDDHCRPTN